MNRRENNACDIMLYVYTEMEQRYYDGQMPAHSIRACAYVIQDCYGLVKDWLKNCDDQTVVREFESKIIKPCTELCDDIEKKEHQERPAWELELWEQIEKSRRKGSV